MREPPSAIKTEAQAIVNKMSELPSVGALIIFQIVCTALSLLARCYSTWSHQPVQEAVGCAYEDGKYSDGLTRRTRHTVHVAAHRHNIELSPEELDRTMLAILDHARCTDPTDVMAECSASY